MKHFNLLARPLAATAVVGFAFLGFAGTAGASTVTVFAPPVVSGVLGSNPVVTVGPGSVAPAPGVTATVPVHGDADAAVDNPNVVSTGTSDPTGLTTSNGHIASAHASVDACVAAALLTDRSPDSCGPRAGGSSSLAQSIARVGNDPSLTNSLANVGACVRVALAAGRPIDTCSASITAPDAGSILNPVSPSILTPVPPVVTPGSASGTATMVADEVGAALANNGLCDVAHQLGLSSLVACKTDVTTNGTAAAHASGHATAANGPASADVCIGLAVLTGVDTRHCTAAASESNGGGTPNGIAGNGTNANNGDNGTAASQPTTVLNSACASSTGSVGGNSPSKGEVAGGFAGLSFLLAGIGRRIRRMKRPVLA